VEFLAGVGSSVLDHEVDELILESGIGEVRSVAETARHAVRANRVRLIVHC